MQRDKLKMLGALTALTLSLVWAAQFIPGGTASLPGLLNLGSLVQAPPQGVNFDMPRTKRCDVDIERAVREASRARADAERVRDETRHIRIYVDGIRDRVKQKIKHVQNHAHRHRHDHQHEWRRRKCRSPRTSVGSVMVIPDVPPIPPIPAVPPVPPIAALPAPGS